MFQTFRDCDIELMNMYRYLKQVCHELAGTLKKQCGNQYGFGDDPESDDDVRNLGRT